MGRARRRGEKLACRTTNGDGLLRLLSRLRPARARSCWRMDIQPAGIGSERVLWRAWLLLLGCLTVEPDMTSSQRLTHAVRPLIGAAVCRWLAGRAEKDG